MSDHDYVPPSGRGPGILMIAPDVTPSLARRAAELASEGYLVRTTVPGGLPDAMNAMSAHAARVGHLAAVAIGAAARPTFELAQQGRFAAVALYDPDIASGPLRAARCPMAVHVGADASSADGSPRAGKPRPELDGRVEIYAYRDAKPGFYDRDGAGWEPYVAGIAYSRTLALFRREIGPHYNLNDLWDYHLACEFEIKDATENMATMVPNPYVNHVPTMTGGVGHDLLKRFYTYHFIGQAPGDRRTIPISRTVGPDRIIEEKVFCFTHDREIDWLLPGVKPTGKYVEIPLVIVVTFRGDKLYNEHIYWDQASVLAQIGLIDPTGLPVAGVEQARKLLDKTRPSNSLMPSWRSSEGKPI
jgi:carboxymethylenebutenolidase